MSGMIQRHPSTAYFAVAFALSWGGLLVAAGGPSGIPATMEQVESRLPLFVLSMLLGPSVAGIVLTGVVDGGEGLRDCLARLLRWRVAVRWYAVALLVAPLLMTGILLALSVFSVRFLPAVLAADDRATVLATGLAIALGAGIFEELGWTGFATPRLRLRHGVLATGLIVGVLWATWHLLPALWLSGTVSGRLSLASYLLDPFLFLVVFRVFMVWVYDRTESVLVAMLMHTSLTFGARVLTPSGISGPPLMIFDVAWAVLMSVVIVVLVAKRPKPQA